MPPHAPGPLAEHIAPVLAASHPEVALSAPSKVEVKLVDAAFLDDYEAWSWFASALWTASVAFIVAWSQSAAAASAAYLVAACVLGMSAVFSAVNAYRKRRLLHANSERIDLLCVTKNASSGGDTND